MSGAEHSLLELLPAVRAHGVRPVLACPDGELARRARERGIDVAEIPGTAGSLALHPVRTPRALGEMARAAWAVRAHAHRTRAALVHANSIRAGLIAIGACRLGAPPAVVHIRDVLPDGRASRAVTGLIRSQAGAIVSNSWYTERALLERGAARGLTAVIHNPIDLERLRGGDRADARARLGLPADAPVLAVVAQITPWKGQADAIEALALVRRRHPDARLVIAGEAKFVDAATRHDNAAYLEALRARAAEIGGDAVAFLGEVSEVREVYAAADVVLSPSWEEPFGRSVAEAMAAGACVIATTAGGPPEFVTDGETGRLLAPRDPRAWADAILDLLDDEPRRLEIGRRAAAHARAFDRDGHARAVRLLYDRLLS